MDIWTEVSLGLVSGILVFALLLLIGDLNEDYQDPIGTPRHR